MTQSPARNEFIRYLAYLFIYFISQKTLRKKHHHGEAIRRTISHGMAMLYLAALLLQPIRDRLVERIVEGIY